MDATFQLTINAASRSVSTDPERRLLDVLREDLGLTGTKYGCGEGECRTCTVLLDDEAVPSCRIPMRAIAGRSIRTIEGLAPEHGLHPIQEAFIAEDAMQCGYCIPGIILTTKALLDANPRPSDDEIHDALNSNLCRCCGYPRIVAAVRRAAAAISEPGGAE